MYLNVTVYGKLVLGKLKEITLNFKAKYQSLKKFFFTDLSYILSCIAASERSWVNTLDSSDAAASDCFSGGVELGVTKSSNIGTVFNVYFTIHCLNINCIVFSDDTNTSTTACLARYLNTNCSIYEYMYSKSLTYHHCLQKFQKVMWVCFVDYETEGVRDQTRLVWCWYH